MTVPITGRSTIIISDTLIVLGTHESGSMSIRVLSPTIPLISSSPRRTVEQPDHASAADVHQSSEEAWYGQYPEFSEFHRRFALFLLHPFNLLFVFLAFGTASRAGPVHIIAIGLLLAFSYILLHHLLLRTPLTVLFLRLSLHGCPILSLSRLLFSSSGVLHADGTTARTPLP